MVMMIHVLMNHHTDFMSDYNVNIERDWHHMAH